MITRAWCTTMARYNAWMNARLYALCATIDDAERRRDRGAFFKSIHSTLNHVVYGDLAFLSRFTGDPAEVPPLGVDLYPDFESLRAVREALDARIEAWSATLDPEWLATDPTYTTKVDGRTRTLPRLLMVTHLFNHQTHHRRQLTTLLSQLGLDIGPPALPFMPPP